MGVTNDHARDVVQNALRTVSEKIQKVNFSLKSHQLFNAGFRFIYLGLLKIRLKPLLDFHRFL